MKVADEHCPILATTINAGTNRVTLVQNHMKNLTFCITLVLLLAQSAWAQSNSGVLKPVENELKDHPAPYLALHGDDPVAWQEWGNSVVLN